MRERSLVVLRRQKMARVGKAMDEEDAYIRTEERGSRVTSRSSSLSVFLFTRTDYGLWDTGRGSGRGKGGLRVVLRERKWK